MRIRPSGAAAIPAAPVVALVVALVLSGVRAVPSLARFTDSATTSGAFTADTLNPPTSLAVGAPVGLTATLTWTATSDTYATGYQLYRSTTSGSGYAFVKSVTGRATTTTTDTPLVPGTYYYVLKAVAGSWLSVNSNQVSVILI